MVDFHDRRSGRPDFSDGSGQFSMPDHDDEQESRWSSMPPTANAKKEVGGFYRNQKSTQTWQEANRLASRRTWRSGGPWSEDQTTSNYAAAYRDNLSKVLAAKGPSLAKKYGEVKPGR